jgi:N-acetyl-gamma-glutamyl-phosphate reductase
VSARAVVVGASGYAGSELCRWLLDHPSIDLAGVCSRQHVGQPLASVAPALAGLTDLAFAPIAPASFASADLVFLALPHGTAGEVAPLVRDARILDLSADHRLDPDWVYGLVDWVGPNLDAASRVAVPGCFATAILLSIAPFCVAGAITGPVCVAAATGSTGAGTTPAPGTHHPERFANFKAYKVLQHQHGAEIGAALGRLGPAPAVHFVPHSAPVDRGIFATTFVPMADASGAQALVREAYAGSPLVRIRAETPEIRHVRGTAFADLAVTAAPGMAVVLSAIDNLGKGAATQAIQCANRMLGLPSDTGLRRAAATP